jgi:hypothetical protein
VTLTLYRDDSTAQVRYENVKTYFFTAGNTVSIDAVIAAQADLIDVVHTLRQVVCVKG